MEQQLYSIIENGVLVKFNSKDLTDGVFIVPNNVTQIGEGAFRGCKNLTEIVFSENVTQIASQAFMNCSSLQTVKLNDQIKKIPDACFWGCFALKNINLNNVEAIQNGAFFACESLKEVQLASIKRLGLSSFFGCENLETVYLSSSLKKMQDHIFEECSNIKQLYIDGKKIKANNNLIYNFKEVYPFLNYAAKNNKFVVNNVGIMLNTKQEDIEKFYAHTKDWKDILLAYTQKWEKLFNNTFYYDAFSKDIFSNLYQICYALGLFENNNQEVVQFIKEHITEISPSRLHKLYGKLDTKNNGYNAEFAEFYIKNYAQPTMFEQTKLYFMEKTFQDVDEEAWQIINYTASIYNNWSKIKEAYPNKSVFSHREQMSEYNNFTLDELIAALNEIQYSNILPGNENMASAVVKYGYSQQDFETLQNWYEKAKQLKEEDLILKIDEQKQQSDIKFSLLKKTDIEALILGEKTNCCQTVDNNGKTCVCYGVTKPNSGFVKFTYNNKIIGQAWVWYNPKTKTVCLDNIEIPLVWNKKLKKDDALVKNFQESLIQMANSFKAEMNKTENKVKRVTIGTGFVDLPGMEAFARIGANEDHLPADYYGYSDASVYQYIIPEKYSDLNLSEICK